MNDITDTTMLQFGSNSHFPEYGLRQKVNPFQYIYIYIYIYILNRG